MISKDEREKFAEKKKRWKEYVEKCNNLEEYNSPEATILLKSALQCTEELLDYATKLIEKLTNREFITRNFSKETH